MIKGTSSVVSSKKAHLHKDPGNTFVYRRDAATGNDEQCFPTKPCIHLPYRVHVLLPIGIRATSLLILICKSVCLSTLSPHSLLTVNVLTHAVGLSHQILRLGFTDQSSQSDSAPVSSPTYPSYEAAAQDQYYYAMPLHSRISNAK